MMTHPCLCGDSACPFCGGGFATDDVQPALTSLPAQECESCPTCKGGCVVEAGVAGFFYDTQHAVCPSCYGTGRKLSPATKALLSLPPEAQDAVLNPFGGEAVCYPADKVKVLYNLTTGHWCAPVWIGIGSGSSDGWERMEPQWERGGRSWRTDQKHGRAPSLAQAVCAALGLEAATDE